MSHPHLITTLVDGHGLGSCKANRLSMGPSLRLTKDEGGPLEDRVVYAEVVGSLLYLAVTTRPDMAYAAGVLSRFMSAPRELHWSAAKSVLRYLRGTMEVGVTFGGRTSEGVRSYVDADYTGDVDSRKSTTGYVFTLHGSAVSWTSKRQPTVATSTAEVELLAVAAATKHALWLRSLLNDFGVAGVVIPIAEDNQSCLAMIANGAASTRAKHLDVALRMVHERVMRQEVVFSYLHFAEMVADGRTKALAVDAIANFRVGLGVELR